MSNSSALPLKRKRFLPDIEMHETSKTDVIPKPTQKNTLREAIMRGRSSGDLHCTRADDFAQTPKLSQPRILAPAILRLNRSSQQFGF